MRKYRVIILTISNKTQATRKESLRIPKKWCKVSRCAKTRRWFSNKMQQMLSYSKMTLIIWLSIKLRVAKSLWKPMLLLCTLQVMRTLSIKAKSKVKLTFQTWSWIDSRIRPLLFLILWRNLKSLVSRELPIKRKFSGIK